MMALQKMLYLETGHLSEEKTDETMGGGGCKGYFRVDKGGAQFNLLRKQRDHFYSSAVCLMNREFV